MQKQGLLTDSPYVIVNKSGHKGCAGCVGLCEMGAEVGRVWTKSIRKIMRCSLAYVNELSA